MSSSTAKDQHVRGRLRKERADAGSVRLSERDGPLLLLIAEQYAISVDQLARLIGRRPRTGRWLRDRWRQAGWVESRQLTVDGPSFLWLTTAGSRIAASPFRTWRPNAAFVPHIEAVTEIRLLLERQLRLGAWVSERSLAKTLCAEGTRAHLPDAVLHTDQGELAIEVELTLKSRSRLETLLFELASSYPAVWYFASAAPLPSLRQLAAELPWQNVTVHPYPPRAAALIT